MKLVWWKKAFDCMCIDNCECIRCENHSHLCEKKKLHNTSRYLFKEFNAALMPVQVSSALLLIVKMGAFLLVFCFALHMAQFIEMQRMPAFELIPLGFGKLVCLCHFSVPFGVSCSFSSFLSQFPSLFTCRFCYFRCNVYVFFSHYLRASSGANAETS